MASSQTESDSVRERGVWVSREMSLKAGEMGWIGVEGAGQEGGTKISQRVGGEVLAKTFLSPSMQYKTLILSSGISDFVGETASLVYENASCSPYRQLRKQKNVTCIVILIVLVSAGWTLSSHAG